MKSLQRPITNTNEFEIALEKSNLLKIEYEIIDYIRFIGLFNQPMLIKDLSLEAKPPVLSRICSACRKIGKYMPLHFELVRSWSEAISADGVRWDGDLICSAIFNIDGKRISPEEGNSQFHNFAVHKELFKGLE